MRIQDNGIIAPRHRRGLLSMCVFSGFLRPSSTAWHSQFHASFVLLNGAIWMLLRFWGLEGEKELYGKHRKSLCVFKSLCYEKDTINNDIPRAFDDRMFEN